MSESRNKPGNRRDQIVNIITEKKIIDVTSLMNIFTASRATITRDIKILVSEGLVKRTYGGVMSNVENPEEGSDYSFDVSKGEFYKEKNAIASAAFSMLNDNDTIILNPGVTTFEIARMIASSELRINIITNSLKFFELFAEDHNRKVILLGGELFHGGHMISGTISNQNMQNLQGDIAIIGVHGIDLSGGLSYPYSQEAELESIMLQRCSKRIVVADHIKFGRICMYKVDFKLEDIDIIITDRKTDIKFIDQLKKKGIEVIVSDVV
jgi:DeoR/GlpR family transcriptional regulator of sugar metabolism